jgi:hypothetical protein
MVCSTDAVCCYLSRGTLTNWYVMRLLRVEGEVIRLTAILTATCVVRFANRYCVLVIRAAIQYGKRIVLVNNPVYFPDDSEVPIDLKDVFTLKAVIFHHDFPYSAAQQVHRILQEKPEEVQAPLHCRLYKPPCTAASLNSHTLLLSLRHPITTAQ